MTDFIRYSAMLLSTEDTEENHLKEHHHMVRDFYKDKLFLRHNLLEAAFCVEQPFEALEAQDLAHLKSRLIATYFS